MCPLYPLYSKFIEYNYFGGMRVTTKNYLNVDSETVSRQSGVKVFPFIREDYLTKAEQSPKSINKTFEGKNYSESGGYNE